MRLRLLRGFAAVPLLVACGGDSGSTAADAAASDATPDADPGCPVPPALGDLGTVTEGNIPAADQTVRFANFAAPGLDAEFGIALVRGYAPFGTLDAPQPLATGSYPLTGNQNDRHTCGVCVQLYVDNPGALDPADGTIPMIATGGALEVTSIDGRFTAALLPFDGEVGVPFESYVDVDGGTSELTGCRTSLTVAFDLEVPPPE